MNEDTYKIGDVVTLKSHPLAFQPNGEIDAYVNQIPPFMCIKEIHIEKKKILFSKEKEDAKIADYVKYLCTYFNQHRMIFEEKYVYHDFLIPLKDIVFHNNDEKLQDNHVILSEETSKYSIAKYKFGERVFFKTYKLEKRKKFKTAGHDRNSTTKTTMTHTSPAFVLSGFKPNDQKNIYNQKDGKIQRECSKELYKITWYNAYQEKFSEEYLPAEFLTDDLRIYQSIKNGIVPLSKDKS
ncbi:hypothetical protein [Zobellia uliginosa]|uniref:hypothetical protein n=1 Tax=Zobellia uliginosa TaxID=143224 RepID=UPI001C07CC57|nr:hypothetical protein [Zobellia uliginosa]MBU2947375.1 hypothetical protein [Zobellia uliginosa]